MNSILFSITIPAYKATFLNKCIESVLCQTYQNFEVLLVEDHSTDKSKDLIKKYVQ